MKTFSKTPALNERSKIIRCPLCDNKQTKPFWDLKDFSYVKCPNCSLVYQNPQPITEDIHERYDDEYFSYEIENEKIFLKLILLGLKDVGFVPDDIIIKNKKILDIGCATGLFLEYMKDRCWDTYGVEVCESAADYGNAKRGLNIFAGTIENAPLKPCSMDVIHLSHVIEHINDPRKFVKRILTLLKPGGIVYCTTPNIDGLQSKLFKENWRSAIADHIVLFSVKTLKRLFIELGFEVETHKTWGGLCANSGYHKLIKEFLDKAAKPMGFGDVMIIKAVKPS